MIEVNEAWFKRLAELAEECDGIDFGMCLETYQLTKLSRLIGYASSARTFINLSKDENT